MNAFLTNPCHGLDLVHAILRIRPPAKKQGRGSDSQDRMDHEGAYQHGVDKRLPDYSQFSSEILLGFTGKLNWREHFNGVDIGIRGEGP